MKLSKIGGEFKGKWNHIYSKDIGEVDIKDIMKDKKVDNVCYRYKWNDATHTSGLVTDTVNNIIFTNYHKKELVDIIEKISIMDPNNYIMCISYSKDCMLEKRAYSDTQIGITGTGCDMGDMIRELEEEIGITPDNILMEEINVESNWHYYTCKVKNTKLSDSYKKLYGLTIRELYNKKHGNKVCGIVTCGIGDMKDIFDTQKSIIRRKASDTCNIYGIDLINIGFLLEYLKWYYTNGTMVGRIRIKF